MERFAMPPGVYQRVQWLLDHYPNLRASTNSLVFGYWVIVDGYGSHEKDFAKLTPLESIVREARKLFGHRPELSPEAAAVDTQTSTDLFHQVVNDVFPNTVETWMKA